MKRILAVIVITALTGCATNLPKQESSIQEPLYKAGDWSKVTTSAEGNNYYVDLSTVKLTPLGHRYAKTVQTNPKNQSVLGIGEFVDCRLSPKKTTSKIADIVIFENGKAVKEELGNRGMSNRPFTEAVSGSVGESVNNAICSAPLIKNYRTHYAEFHDTIPLTIAVNNTSPTTSSSYSGGSSGGYGGSCAENGSCYGDTSVLTGRSKDVHVQGYYRKDGTYVRGHYRSSPSSRGRSK